MKFGYMRVSTFDQNLDSQKDILDLATWVLKMHIHFMNNMILSANKKK
ncbi:hypothetical protein [Metabacillus bambusae]|uniref:Resolvase/invertase-type recombinase catalytic domain-containing protein n=1 Tax=Metabacillus bambusae TaxID=2795218 RepID=A0ABS3MYE9_9BACI|nr:hypothetical protein [Metabacillus bambusae]MBO1511032.1 hypothetical protein [Metabacillus bambusae]